MVYGILPLTCKKYLLVNGSQVSKIDFNAIILKLVNFSYFKDMFSVIVTSCDIKIQDGVIKSTLYNIIALYVRIWTFSYVKDKVQKYTLQNKYLLKNSSLRKELKWKSNEEGK